MTGFEVDVFAFGHDELDRAVEAAPRYRSWPVVYALHDDSQVYVGETLSADQRLHQHLESPTKSALTCARVFRHDEFNKSAALDLESQLIRLLAGDGRFEVLNRNQGILDADYFDRRRYRDDFEEVFERLHRAGFLTRPVEEIHNSDLYKLSPFKTLTEEQALAVEAVLELLVRDITAAQSSAGGPLVVEGEPGTGKTVVAIYLAKLLRDLGSVTDDELHRDIDRQARFADHFTAVNRGHFRDAHIGFVVPQQALRTSLKRVFARTPDLDEGMILTPFDVGESPQHYDVLIVDEAHRLNRRSNQPSAKQNTRFAEITRRLFGEDDLQRTQLDWIRRQSCHQILLLDKEQTVRPGDLDRRSVEELIDRAKDSGGHHRLVSQLRLNAGEGYIPAVRAMLSGGDPDGLDLGEYQLAMFDDAGAMHDHIRALDAGHGLARMAAGYAWDWTSKPGRKRRTEFDFTLDGRRFRWNSTDKDWANSPNALDEVGSIHTLQGYDLNYAGVIIGPDLRYDERTGRTTFDRGHYADPKGRENNPKLGLTFSDEDIRDYVINIYTVLMTRGIRGTFLYVCDPPLRRRLSRFVPFLADPPSGDRGSRAAPTADLGHLRLEGEVPAPQQGPVVRSDRL
ncbi:MAG: DUF2075 domain-containing protein [Nesterenkonia sp.]|nr:DUF2075 domain-containing protein [Nesterenkonia sp.]